MCVCEFEKREKDRRSGKENDLVSFTTLISLLNLSLLTCLVVAPFGFRAPACGTSTEGEIMLINLRARASKWKKKYIAARSWKTRDLKPEMCGFQSVRVTNGQTARWKPQLRSRDQMSWNHPVCQAPRDRLAQTMTCSSCYAKMRIHMRTQT